MKSWLNCRVVDGSGAMFGCDEAVELIWLRAGSTEFWWGPFEFFAAAAFLAAVAFLAATAFAFLLASALAFLEAALAFFSSSLSLSCNFLHPSKSSLFYLW